jgi:hypothetical protein
MANEASKSAGHVLRMCIRAIDYCPPVDLTFGDYLRAIITADVDLVANDNKDYRLAFIEAFKKRGIFPKGIKTLSVESLNYGFLSIDDPQLSMPFNIIKDFLRRYCDEIFYVSNREEIHRIKSKYISGGDGVQGLHQRLYVKFDGMIAFEKLTGLCFNSDFVELGINPSRRTGYTGYPSYQIHSLHYLNRTGPNGKMIRQVMITLMQHAGIELSNKNGIKSAVVKEKSKNNQFVFYGGCTLIFDLENGSLKVISKPLLDLKLLEKNKKKLNMERINNQIEYKKENENIDDYHLYFSDSKTSAEPFAFLHRH